MYLPRNQTEQDDWFGVGDPSEHSRILDFHIFGSFVPEHFSGVLRYMSDKNFSRFNQNSLPPLEIFLY